MKNYLQLQKKLDAEEGDDSNLEEINGPECLWRDGEHEPEGDPEEWIDRVADEVEEKTSEDASRETRGKRKRNQLLERAQCV